VLQLVETVRQTSVSILFLSLGNDRGLNDVYSVIAKHDLVAVTLVIDSSVGRIAAAGFFYKGFVM
jgi:hypothetical protein